MAENRESFAVYQMLEEQGLEFKGLDGSGNPMVYDSSTKEEYPIDFKRVMADQGIDPTKADLHYNRPEQALPESPISLGDRFKLAFSNQDDKLAYLKSTYGDAVFDKKKGMLVRNQGAWHEVDPEFFGDGDMGRLVQGAAKALRLGGPVGRLLGNAIGGRPSDKMEGIKQGFQGVGQATSEVFKGTAGAVKSIASGEALTDLPGDIADLPDDVIRAAMEGGSAVLSGGNPLAVGAASAGATVVNAEIGKALGVNSQSRATIAKQAAVDSVLGMGAQWLATLNRPVTDTILSATGVGTAEGPRGLIAGIKKLGRSMDAKTQSAFANMTQNLTKRDANAVETLLQAPIETVKQIGVYASAAGDEPGWNAVQQGLRAAQQDKRNILQQMFDKASDAVSARWARGEELMARSAEMRGSKISGQKVFDGFAQALDESGLGEIIEEGGKKIFKMFDTESRAARVMAGKRGLPGDDAVQAAVQGLVDDFAYLASKGDVTGAAATRLLMDRKKQVSASVRKLMKEAGGAKTPTGAALSQFSDVMSNTFTNVIEATGNTRLSSLWANVLQKHNEVADPIRQARALLMKNSEEGFDKLTKQVLSRPEMGGPKKDLVDVMRQVLGKEGDELYKKFRIAHAAQSFLKDSPEMGMLQALGLTGIAASTIGVKSGAGKAGLVAAGATLIGQSNPRRLAHEAAAMHQAKKAVSKSSEQFFKMMRSLTPGERYKFIRDPNLIDAVTRSTIEAEAHEAMTYEQLMGQVNGDQ